MDTVHFSRDFSKLEETSQNLLKDFFTPNKEIFVKIHFGEPGNKYTFTPDQVEPIIKALEEISLKPTLIDTPVTYPSPRNSVKGYEKVVRDAGWTDRYKTLISDNYKEFKTKNLSAEVCRELIEKPNVLVLSHIKGHGCCGFGGAIKNLGMGGLSPKTKNDIHTGCKPKFVAECQGCGTCAELCPFGAIKMVEGKAKIDLNVCEGCSLCEYVCPHSCLAPEVAYFEDLLAQGASAVINHMPKNTYYINVLKNITHECDCWDDPGEIICDDVGVLFSKNPVAIDAASVDVIRKKHGNIFEKEHHRDPYIQVDFAEKYTEFKREYKLEEI